MGLKWVDDGKGGKILIEEDRALGGNFNTIPGGSGTSIGPGGSNIGSYSNLGNFSKLDGYGLGANQSIMNSRGLINNAGSWNQAPPDKVGLLEKYGLTKNNMDIFSSAMTGVGSAVDALMAFKTYKLNKEIVADNRQLTRANYNAQLGVLNREIAEDNAFKQAQGMYNSVQNPIANAYS